MSLDDIEQRVKALEDRPAAQHGQHGRHGRDGRGLPGPMGPAGVRGPAGPEGREGPAGRDSDEKRILETVLRHAEKLVALIPTPSDGKDSTVPGPRGLPGVVGQGGKDGATGPRGPAGSRGPVGPKPDHEWDGTKLGFEDPDGVIRQFVDLKGPRGPKGLSVEGGGGGGGIIVANSYFPGGW